MISGNGTRREINELAHKAVGIDRILSQGDHSGSSAHAMSNNLNLLALFKDIFRFGLLENLAYHLWNIIKTDSSSVKIPVIFTALSIGLVPIREERATAASNPNVITRVKELLWDRIGHWVSTLHEPIAAVIRD